MILNVDEGWHYSLCKIVVCSHHESVPYHLRMPFGKSNNGVTLKKPWLRIDRTANLCTIDELHFGFKLADFRPIEVTPS